MSDFEIWRTIEAFPNYAVSNFGNVRNIKFDKPVAITKNQQGVEMVGLSKGGQQYKRARKTLVARAFVSGYSDENCNVVCLDGDPDNIRPSNLAWRPHWFAMQYYRQFLDIPDWVFTGPVIDSTTNRVYETILAAGVAIGALWEDIRTSLMYHSAVYPTNTVFAYM